MLLGVTMCYSELCKWLDFVATFDRYVCPRVILVFVDEKIACNLETDGRTLVQFYAVMYLS